MLKIVTNHKKQDVTYALSLGQAFPQVEGKLIRLELSGAELSRFIQEKEIPICAIDTSCLVWHGKAAGHVLKILREIL
jgi:hypothetical protein